MSTDRGARVAIMLALYRRASTLGLRDDEAAIMLACKGAGWVSRRCFRRMRSQLAEAGILASVGDRWVWTGGIQ